MYTSVVEVIVLRHVIPTAIASKATDLKEKLDMIIMKLSNASTSTNSSTSTSTSSSTSTSTSTIGSGTSSTSTSSSG